MIFVLAIFDWLKNERTRSSLEIVREFLTFLYGGYFECSADEGAVWVDVVVAELFTKKKCPDDIIRVIWGETDSSSHFTDSGASRSSKIIALVVVVITS